MKPVLEKSNKKVNDAFEKMHGKMKVIKLRNLLLRYLFIGIVMSAVYVLTFFVNYEGTIVHAVGVVSLGIAISCFIKVSIVGSKMMLAKKKNQ